LLDATLDLSPSLSLMSTLAVFVGQDALMGWKFGSLLIQSPCCFDRFEIRDYNIKVNDESRSFLIYLIIVCVIPDVM